MRWVPRQSYRSASSKKVCKSVNVLTSIATMGVVFRLPVIATQNDGAALHDFKAIAKLLLIV